MVKYIKEIFYGIVVHELTAYSRYSVLKFIIATTAFPD